MTRALDRFVESCRDPFRRRQAEIVDAILCEHLPEGEIEFIETGCSSGVYDDFGLYFGGLVLERGGSVTTVDISGDYISRSKSFYSEMFPGLPVDFHVRDSVEFLLGYQGSPNLVHLDSYDLDITNPVPSMLHGWLEFEAVAPKVREGGIVIFDDNFFKGTRVYWNHYHNGEMVGMTPVDITAEVMGKGAIVWEWVRSRGKGWEILGDHYRSVDNTKIVLRKKTGQC